MVSYKLFFIRYEMPTETTPVGYSERSSTIISFFAPSLPEKTAPLSMIVLYLIY